MTTLGNADGGSSITVRVSTELRVVLAADPGTRWTAPEVDDQTVLKPVSSSAGATGASAVFRATQAGETRLTAIENPTCLPLCGRPSRLWQVMVTVAS